MDKVHYNFEPQQLQRYPDGSTRFRWDIEPIENEEGDTLYACYECVIHTTPSPNNILRAAINAMWSRDTEGKLTNDYYAAVAGILDESYKQPYLDFLTARAALKATINAYFES
jgi:hypothetical protein